MLKMPHRQALPIAALLTIITAPLPAFASSFSGGIDTPTGVVELPFAVGGVTGMEVVASGSSQTLLTANWGAPAAPNVFVAGNISTGGTVTVGSSLAVGSTVTVGSSVTATAFYQTSDARLKTNIRTSKGLDVIDGLRGVTFDWKNGSGHSTGVLAQDVEKVLPSAVHTEADGHKTVEYSQLMGPVIEAIKELREENRELKAENAELRSKIDP